MKADEKLRSLYLHIPFCVRKCSYCDFYSISSAKAEIMEQYAARLCEVIRQWGTELGHISLETVYIGGGTPSLLSEQSMDAILTATGEAFSLDAQTEISMEANPATMSLEKARAFRASGIGRISLGVQSFQPEELQTMGRLHGVREVLETVDCIRQAGFTNYNLDLIYGVPGQTLISWEQSLHQALELSPTHLSLYLLQMDERVPLARRIERGELSEPEEDSVVEMFYRSDELLREKGYTHYEISNFARAGYECRHNLEYWKSHPYLGLGAGAVSYLEGCRFKLSPDVRHFLAKDSEPALGRGEILEEMTTPQERLADALVMGLRCMRGVDTEELTERFGIDPMKHYEREIAECTEAGLLTAAGNFLRLTRKGWFLSNQVFWRFL